MMNSPDNDAIRNLPLVIETPDENKRANPWQIILTTFGLIAIVTIFLWGLNNQRDETVGGQTAATMPAPVSSQGGDAQPAQQAGAQPQTPSTTGQGSDDQKDRPNNTGQKPEKQPAKDNGEPAQRQSK